MGGRNALPISIIKSQKKTHITKAEEARRKAAEVKLGEKALNDVKPPDYIKNDLVAKKYWDQHLAEYVAAAKKGHYILTSSDVGSLAFYCKTYAEYLAAIKRKEIYELNYPGEIDTILKLEHSVNKKLDMLIKMQDRLFLNPLAKIKNVPKQDAPVPNNPMEQEFDL